MSKFSQQFDADHRSLSNIRAAYRAWFESDETEMPASATGAIDTDVVVTELAANVIDHTDSPWVWLEITASPSTVMVTVSHIGPASKVPDVALWGVLDEGDRGRGLRVVRALCDRIEVAAHDEKTSIRCRLVT